MRPTSVITASLGLLTLGIVSSTHGQLVTLLPSVPLSPGLLQALGPLAHSGTLRQAAPSSAPQRHVSPFITAIHLHTGGLQFKRRGGTLLLNGAPCVWIWPGRGANNDPSDEKLAIRWCFCSKRLLESRQGGLAQANRVSKRYEHTQTMPHVCVSRG